MKKLEINIDELKKNALGVLSLTRKSIVLRFPFIGNVSMKLNIIPVRDRRCQTACTDGTNIYFDIAFLSELNDAERMFVLGHEIWHTVMLHFTRKGCRDANLFNIAADLEVNLLLKKDGFASPKNLCFPDKFGFPNNMSAEEYYELLIKNVNKQKTKTIGSNNTNNQSKKGFDRVDSLFDKHAYLSFDENEKEAENITDKYGEVGLDDDFNPTISDDIVDKVREMSISAALQVEMTRGNLPAHISTIINKLKHGEISWKEYLASFTTRCIGEKRLWYPPNRRHVWHNSYLQSRRGERLKIAIGLDTSASTTDNIPKFLGEINNLIKTFSSYDIHLIQCDADITSYKMYDENNLLDIELLNFKVEGLGGTRLHPIFDFIKNNQLDVDCYIIFTDGYIELFPKSDDPGKPVLWMLTKNGLRELIEFGEKVMFNET